MAAQALGIGLEALVAVRLVRHSREAFRELYRPLLSLPEVLAVFHLSGLNDLQVHVAVRDIQHLRDLIVERFAGRPEVGHCETAVIFELNRKHELPCYLGADRPPASGRPRAKRKARPQRK